MNCVICKHGQTKPGKVSVTLERDGSTLVFKSVPAQVCDNCGEQYVNSETTDRSSKPSRPPKPVSRSRSAPTPPDRRGR